MISVLGLAPEEAVSRLSALGVNAVVREAKSSGREAGETLRVIRQKQLSDTAVELTVSGFCTSVEEYLQKRF